MTNPDFAQHSAKFNMIEQQIRPWEVLDHQVLSTLNQLDREDYVRESYKGLAYADCQIPVGDGVRMLPPTIEGRMLQALTIETTDEVLEIGSGSGYISACLAKLAQQVTSIDTNSEIIDFARSNLAGSGLNNIEFQQIDASQIVDTESYDVITVTASMEVVPENLKQALKPGGRLFVIVGDAPVMQALLLTRVGESEWTTRSLFETDIPRLKL